MIDPPRDGASFAAPDSQFHQLMKGVGGVARRQSSRDIFILAWKSYLGWGNENNMWKTVSIEALPRSSLMNKAMASHRCLSSASTDALTAHNTIQYNTIY